MFSWRYLFYFQKVKRAAFEPPLTTSSTHHFAQPAYFQLI